MADQLEAARAEMSRRTEEHRIDALTSERDAARAEADLLRARVAADEQRIDALVQEVRLAQYERDRAQGRAAKLEAQVADRSR